MTPEVKQLRKIRDRLFALGDAEWLLSSDGGVSMVETQNADGELNEIARFHRGASPQEIDFIINAPGMVDFLLKLVDRAIAANRKTAANQARREPKDFAAECAMKCTEPAFKAFLEQRHGLQRPLTDDRAIQRLRTVLGITSRKELNNDEAAADRWRTMRADYATFRKAGK